MKLNPALTRKVIPKPREKDVQKVLRDWLHAFGAFVIRCNSGAMKGEHGGKRWFMRFNDQPGGSDLLVVMPDARFAAIEVKRPGGKPTDLQTAFLGEVSRRGGLALCVSSLSQLIEALRLEGYDPDL